MRERKTKQSLDDLLDERGDVSSTELAAALGITGQAVKRSLRSVFAEYTSEDLEFNRTRTIVKLFGLGVDFVSRSEARRLLHGLERFREVIVDFAGVDGIGQGFADEVFRVYPAAHTETRFTPVNMNEAVAFMVRRALPK